MDIRRWNIAAPTLARARVSFFPSSRIDLTSACLIQHLVQNTLGISLPLVILNLTTPLQDRGEF